MDTDTKGDELVIKGSSGKRTLAGTISVRGAKNAALKAVAASLLFRDEVVMKNVPMIEDMHRAFDILRALGADVDADETKHAACIVPPRNIPSEMPETIANRLRASVVFTGPMLARTGKVVFPHPGGCLIGARPIDLFLSGFEKMGARVRERKNGYTITAPEGGLHGAEIFFPTPSVTGTETLMMAASLARGTTVLKNAAMEPEIQALASFLNESGASITGAGTPEITIRGTKGKPLRAKGGVFQTPPDRIEAGSFILLAAVAGRDVSVTECNPEHLGTVLSVLENAGVPLEIGKTSVRVKTEKPVRSFVAQNIKTREYPGFPTDLQAPMVSFLTQANGEALVFETIFEGRFRYVDALQKMGADITACDPHRIIVRGPAALSGRTLESPDLRAGLAYIIAAAVARGTSTIHNVYMIDRGYEKIEERLKNIGLDIARTGM